MECSPLSQEESTNFDIDDKYLGVWTLRRCPEVLQFDALKQKCVEKRETHVDNCIYMNEEPDDLKTLKMHDDGASSVESSIDEDNSDEISSEWKRKPRKKSKRRLHWARTGGCYAACQGLSRLNTKYYRC